MATPKWLKDVMDKSSRAGGMARSRANAPTKEELQKANKQAKDYLTNIGLTMIPVGLIGTKVGQALAKGYGKAIGEGITNTLQRGGSSPIARTVQNNKNLKNPFNRQLVPDTLSLDKTWYLKNYTDFLTSMKPREFLALASRLKQNKGDRETIEKMKLLFSKNARGKSGLKAQDIKNIKSTPFLEVIQEGKGLKVLGHEGRHRATAAKELGVKEIPVTIATAKRNIKDFLPKRDYIVNKNILGERGSAAERFKRRYKKNLKVK